MRYWLLPMLFKRQFVRYQFGKSQQGIDLYQDYFELYARSETCANARFGTIITVLFFSSSI
jgi:hypothetical protein